MFIDKIPIFNRGFFPKACHKFVMFFYGNENGLKESFLEMLNYVICVNTWRMVKHYIT